MAVVAMAKVATATAEATEEEDLVVMATGVGSEARKEFLTRLYRSSSSSQPQGHNQAMRSPVSGCTATGQHFV
eukprot:1102598-Pleurochrysis_carterae.AAC.1